MGGWLCKYFAPSGISLIQNIYRSLEAPLSTITGSFVWLFHETVLPDSIIDSSGSLICPPKTLYHCCVMNALNNVGNQAITGDKCD